MQNSKEETFISYSRKDFEVVKGLVSSAVAMGSEVFIDKDDIKYGERWKSVIEDRIKNAKTFIIYWSENSAASVNVREEYQAALKIPNLRIVPCTLDDTPLPPELAQFHAVTEAKPIFFKNKSTTRWLRISQALLLMVIVVSGGWVWSLHQQLAQYAGMMPEPTPEVVSFPTSGNRPSLGARARARAPQQKQQPEVNYWLAVIIFTAIIALTVLILLLRGRRKRLIRSINEIIIRDSALRSGT